MRIIGIKGGVGSGKSRVLSYMEQEYGAVICQADHVAWELQRPGETGYCRIVSCFGENILNEDGTINRGTLGQIVFADKEKLGKLNQILHPAVKVRIREQIAAEKAKGTKLFVLEAALLLEEHYDEICDELWYIYTDKQVRTERLIRDRGYSEEKISSMMASQAFEETYRRGCQKVIDNSRTFEETCEQIAQAIKQ